MTAHPGSAERDAGPVSRAAAGLVEQLVGQVADRVVLLQLELRRATGAFALVVGLALAGAILAATAWVSLCGLVGWYALEHGIGMGWVAGGVIGLNLLLCIGALALAVRLMGAIGIPLTLQHLTRHARRDDAVAAEHQAGWAP